MGGKIIKKLLYIAPVKINYEKLDGVGKKVMNHYKIFNNHFQTYLVGYSNNNIITYYNGNSKIISNNNRHRRFALFNYVLELMKKQKFDCIYLRYPKSEINLIHMLKKLKTYNPDINIVVEIPTYPYNGDMFNSVKNIIMAVIDSFYSTKLKKYVNRIVTYTDDNEIFGIKTIKTINGVIFNSINRRDYTGKIENINLIAVSGMWPCHGYDRVIKGLHNYYINGGLRYVNFFIVGQGEESEKYKELVQKYDLVEHVTLYGYKTGKELDDIYSRSNLAVNSLAIHRIKLKTESTLKTKEYAAKGLPIISSYPVDAMPPDTGKYIFIVPADESDVSINSIISFYDSIYNENVSVEKISDDIRSYSQSICDMKFTLNEIIVFYGG